MKLKMITIMAVALGIMLPAGYAAGQQDQALKSRKEKISYGLGVSSAKNLRQQGIEIDADLFIKGLRDGLAGGKLSMDEEDLRKTMAELQAEMRTKQRLLKKTAAEENKKKGDAFLKENSRKEGVVTLPSGLQYRIVKAAVGKKPTDADTVECHYQGMHIDGSIFDSSYKSGQPVTFKVKGGVIAGWTEALKLMPVGSKWQFFVPPHLAYGEQGAGYQVGPNETLVFDVELLAIK